LDALSREQAKSPPDFPQSGEFYTGRIVGNVPMKAPIFMGHDLRYRKDSGVEFPPPFLNPAPDQQGVLRFICQTKGLDSSMYQMAIDQIRLDMPPSTEDGWWEFENGPIPEARNGLAHRLPKIGRFSWSGWGALYLSSPAGGTATFRTMIPVAVPKASSVVVRGCLAPGQGGWQVKAGDTGTPIALAPGKDEQQVVEWTIPLAGFTTPGEISLTFTCLQPGEKGPRMHSAPDAELCLDSWALR
jgi:hypothetical protein